MRPEVPGFWPSYVRFCGNVLAIIDEKMILETYTRMKTIKSSVMSAKKNRRLMHILT